MNPIPTDRVQIETLISSLRIGERPGFDLSRLFSTAFDWKLSYDVPGVRQLIGVDSPDAAFQFWFSLGFRDSAVTNAHLQALRLIRDYVPAPRVLGPSITLEIT